MKENLLLQYAEQLAIVLSKKLQKRFVDEK